MNEVELAQIIRRRLGGHSVEDDGHADNLAIVLCTYFSDHLQRPEEDRETEEADNGHWGEWVTERHNLALDRIALEIAKDLVEHAKVERYKLVRS